MQKIFLVISFIFVTFSSFAQNAVHDKILGLWQSEDKTRIIEFVQSGSGYEAIILKSDPATYEGRKQITGLKAYKNEYKYIDGTIHIYQKNKTGSCSVTLLSNTRMEITMSVGPVTKKMVFTRLE